MDPEIKAVPIGEAELLRDGDDVLILAIGTLVHPALEAAVELSAEGVSAAVVNARFVKPLDIDRILPLARRCGAVLTVEEHVRAGGFGAAVLEALAAADLQVPTRQLAVPDELIEHGNPDAILECLGLDAGGIAGAARALVERRPRADR
jgi:1-deoxy-D-xylulose-5-phosphate synthase